MSAFFFGLMAEWRAARHVRARGGRVAARRFRAAGGEIDLIARYGETYAFIEVKARPGTRMGGGADAVNADKRSRLRGAALAYLARAGKAGAPFQFDIAEVSRAGIQYIENAF